MFLKNIALKETELFNKWAREAVAQKICSEYQKKFGANSGSFKFIRFDNEREEYVYELHLKFNKGKTSKEPLILKMLGDGGAASICISAIFFGTYSAIKIPPTPKSLIEIIKDIKKEHEKTKGLQGKIEYFLPGTFQVLRKTLDRSNVDSLLYQVAKRKNYSLKDYLLTLHKKESQNILPEEHEEALNKQLENTLNSVALEKYLNAFIFNYYSEVQKVLLEDISDKKMHNKISNSDRPSILIELLNKSPRPFWHRAQLRLIKKAKDLNYNLITFLTEYQGNVNSFVDRDDIRGFLNSIEKKFPHELESLATAKLLQDSSLQSAMLLRDNIVSPNAFDLVETKRNLPKGIILRELIRSGSLSQSRKIAEGNICNNLNWELILQNSLRDIPKGKKDQIIKKIKPSLKAEILRILDRFKTTGIYYMNLSPYDLLSIKIKQMHKNVKTLLETEIYENFHKIFFPEQFGVQYGYSNESISFDMQDLFDQYQKNVYRVFKLYKIPYTPTPSLIQKWLIESILHQPLSIPSSVELHKKVRVSLEDLLDNMTNKKPALVQKYKNEGQKVLAQYEKRIGNFQKTLSRYLNVVNTYLRETAYNQDIKKRMQLYIQNLTELMLLFRQEGFAYRDGKPTNFFVKEDGSYVMFDMPSAIWFKQGFDQMKKHHSYILTPGYGTPSGGFEPQILKKAYPNVKRILNFQDWRSFYLMMYEIIVGTRLTHESARFLQNIFVKETKAIAAGMDTVSFLKSFSAQFWKIAEKEFQTRMESAYEFSTFLLNKIMIPISTDFIKLIRFEIKNSLKLIAPQIEAYDRYFQRIEAFEDIPAQSSLDLTLQISHYIDNGAWTELEQNYPELKKNKEKYLSLLQVYETLKTTKETFETSLEEEFSLKTSSVLAKNLITILHRIVLTAMYDTRWDIVLDLKNESKERTLKTFLKFSYAKATCFPKPGDPANIIQPGDTAFFSQNKLYIQKKNKNMIYNLANITEIHLKNKVKIVLADTKSDDGNPKNIRVQENENIAFDEEGNYHLSAFDATI